MPPRHTARKRAPDRDFFAEIHSLHTPVPRRIVVALLDLAIEIAREGREGRKIGTLFVVSDEDEVAKRSRCLILDPLAGHPKAHKKLSDPNLRETVKELAQLGGDFIVSADGDVLSATRYFNASSLFRSGERHSMTSRIAVRLTQQWLQWRPRRRPCRQAVPASAGNVRPRHSASRQQAR